MKRHVCRFLFTICLVVSALATTAFAADGWDGETIADSFDGGSGTASNPYQIATGAQLAYLANWVDSNYDDGRAHFILTDDINLNGHPWTPIGGTGNPFADIFNGDDHTISDLNVTSAVSKNQKYYAGLFGVTSTAHSMVENLTVDGTIGITIMPTTSSILYAGGVIGFNASVTVENCYASGEVSTTAKNANNQQAGGVVGRNGGTVADCYWKAMQRMTLALAMAPMLSSSLVMAT